MDWINDKIITIFVYFSNAMRGVSSGIPPYSAGENHRLHDCRLDTKFPPPRNSSGVPRRFHLVGIGQHSSTNGEPRMAAALPPTARPRDTNPLLPTTPLVLPSKPFQLKLKAPLLDRRMRRAGNASVFPVVRAGSCPDYVPDAKFYKVEAIVRSWRVPHVSLGLLKMGIRGVTIFDVKGFGAQGVSAERQGGSEFSEDKLVAKTKMETIVSKDQVEAVIEKIIEEARTGEIGDGKIFLTPVSDLIRIRTGERGEKAERMTGGCTDMISAISSD